MVKRGKIIIVTGPSGAGKTAISSGLLNIKELDLQRVITCTTRQKRTGEVDGKDYFFISKEEFLDNIKNNKMFEYAPFLDNYYGSRKIDVEKILNSGKNILFTIDVKGALTLKKSNNAIVFFIQAENLEELKKRLNSRSTDSPKVIKERMRIALEEMKTAKFFDYIITNYNGKLQESINKVAEIIKNISNISLKKNSLTFINF